MMFMLHATLVFAQLLCGITQSPPEFQRTLEQISADSMRGRLSFLSSDLLEGRDTPSTGLNLAAEYIAAEYRRAGLESITGEEYFQTTTMDSPWRAPQDLQLSVSVGSHRFALQASDVSAMEVPHSLELANTPMTYVDFVDPQPPGEHGALSDHVILTELPDFPATPPDSIRNMLDLLDRFRKVVQQSGAPLVLSIDRTSPTGQGLRSGLSQSFMNLRSAMVLRIHKPELIAALDEARTSGAVITVSLRLPEPRAKPIKVHNVIGVLPGSDPVLRDEYVVISAHYDHLGMDEFAPADNIYNGANDDGSGVVSVIELASAFAHRSPPLRRSLMFVCYYGEELGMVGSRYFVDHPVVPLRQIVANVNLEQIGRIDDSSGTQAKRLMPTGFDYSSMIRPFIGAGEAMGVEVVPHAQFSAMFFDASDNAPFAEQGIPAHSFSTAFIFPDYHRPGDHWSKIDFENMALIDRVLAVGIVTIADDDARPTWTSGLAATAVYEEAARHLRDNSQH